MKFSDRIARLEQRLRAGAAPVNSAYDAPVLIIMFDSDEDDSPDDLWEVESHDRAWLQAPGESLDALTERALVDASRGQLAAGADLVVLTASCRHGSAAAMLDQKASS